MTPVTESLDVEEPAGDGDRLHTVDAAIDRAQAIARVRRSVPGRVVDEFIAERREDALRSDAGPTLLEAPEQAKEQSHARKV